MSEKIPEDLMKTARTVAFLWYHEEWDENNYMCQRLVKDIARALLAERERCADAVRKVVMSIRKGKNG